MCYILVISLFQWIDSLYKYTHTYLHICVYIHTYILMDIFMYICVHTCTYMHIYVYICKFRNRKHIYTCMCSYIYIYMYIYMCIYMKWNIIVCRIIINKKQVGLTSWKEYKFEIKIKDAFTSYFTALWSSTYTS